MSIKKTNLPYVAEPQVNFFLYPPMHDVLPYESMSMEEKLDLDLENTTNKNFTVYISIPYCRNRCHSCCCFRGFLPTHTDKDIFLEDYLSCLISQIEAYATKKRFSKLNISSVYIGGGTASILSMYQIDKLLSALNKNFLMEKCAEINLEGNPVDLTYEYLKSVKQSGINRLSIGFQSNQNNLLEALNVYHTAADGCAAIENALKAQIDVVNVDLLYNIPKQTKSQWQDDLKFVIKTGVPSISAGDYIVFQDSKAKQLIQEGKLPKQKNADIVNEWYRWTCNELAKNNYYEQVRGIFVKPGFEQKYVDQSCNQNLEIVGFGAGAYCFINGYQFRIPCNSQLYKQQIKMGKFFEADFVSPQCSRKNMMERYIIHNLYSARLNVKNFQNKFGESIFSNFNKILDALQKNKLIEFDNDEIMLTDLGKKWRRSIYYEFFQSEFAPNRKSVMLWK